MRPVFLEGRPLHIFPCRADKRPCTPHGHLDAASDAASIAELWARYPGPLVGVATGAIGGISVIDIDPNGESWFHAHRDQLPQTRTHKTRREGWHLIYRNRPGLRCSNGRIAKGIDIKSDGGFVIWWPSAAGRVLCSGPIAPFPAWVIAALAGTEVSPLDSGHLLNGHEGQACSRLGSEISLNPNRPHLLPVEPTRNFPRRIDHILRKVETAKPGERNRLLYWAACRFAEIIAEGKLKPAMAEQLLQSAAWLCKLTQTDGKGAVAATIRSGLTRAVSR